MRLIVVAPTIQEGKWAAEHCRRNILISIGYGLSGYQIFVFSPPTVKQVRGFSLKEGDHVFYVDGWTDDAELVREWGVVEATGQGVWSAYHRRVSVPS